MSFAVTVKDAQDLRRLIPLNILSASRFEELCAKTAIEEVARGTVLFNQGDTKNEFVYLLSGTVSLQASGMEMDTITGGTESARFALAHQVPRKVSAVARDRVRFIRVDSAYVNQPSESVSGAVATYEVSDIPNDVTDDWVTTLLKSPIFRCLPPANLQSILSLLEDVSVRAGQEIIHQDEPGDYYYVIKHGRCALTRRPSRMAKEIKLAELKTADTFGEDSLISDQPRNVTVTMITDGALLRLNKANFLKLVKEPVINFVNMEVAQKMIAQGARWLDVRAIDSFEEGHLPEAINVPFFRLRMELPGLSHQCKYILLCETGKVSEAAAFLLIRYEFDAFVLKGGVSGIFKDQLISGAEQPVIATASGEEVLAVDAGSRGFVTGRLPPEREPQPAAALGRANGRAVTEMAGIHTLTEAPDTELAGVAGLAGEGASQPTDHVGAMTVDGLASEISHLKQRGKSSRATADIHARSAAAEAGRDEIAPRKQAVVQAGEKHYGKVEANLRKAVLHLRAEKHAMALALADAKAESDELREKLRQAQERFAVVEDERGSPQQVQLCAEQESERMSLLQRNIELAQQVAELEAVVVEFTGWRSQVGLGGKNGTGSSGAGLDAAQAHLPVGAAGLGDGDPSEQQAWGGRGRWIWALSLFGMLMCGAALGIALAVGTDAGRFMMRDLIAPVGQKAIDSGLESP